MAPTHEEFSHDHIPIGYFITFRTYGTWLHGDPRGSVDRFHNKYGTPRLAPNRLRQLFERKSLKMRPVRLSLRQRKVVAASLREICKKLNWSLWAVNARTNHVHVVITAPWSSKRVRARLKANATKAMREQGCWRRTESPWADKGSRRNLWTYQDLYNAIAYVLYDQGE